MTQLQKTPLEEAKLLNQHGFDWEHDTYYDKDGNEFDSYELGYGMHGGVYYPVPTIQLALKWLRDTKGIDVDISRHMHQYNVLICINKSKRLVLDNDGKCVYFDTYEHAELEALRQALKKLSK